MWIVKLVIVHTYAYIRRTDTCLSFDSWCFSNVQTRGSRSIPFLGFNDMRLSPGSQRHIGGVIANSKAMFASYTNDRGVALAGAGPHNQESNCSVIGGGSLCG
jgi:hypothetical protein